MSKRILSFLMSVLMVAMPMQVHAEEIAYSKYIFSAMDDLIVTIPSSMNLEYKSGLFTKTDSVTVSGVKTNTKEYNVNIAVDDTDVVYVNQDVADSSLQGKVYFGTDGVESWSGDEVADGVSKDITITVDDIPTEEGTYRGSIDYSINVVKNPIDDGYFTKTVNTDGASCTITGLTETGSAWLSSLGGRLEIPDTQVIEGTEYPVTHIGDKAFKDNTIITSVAVPDSVTYLGTQSFRNIDTMTSFDMGSGVSETGTDIFRGCDNLVTCNLSEKLTYINAATFADCISLNNIIIPEGVTYIDCFAFQICTSLESVVIPDACESISVGAFYGCTALNDLVIPVDCDCTISSATYASKTYTTKQFYNCPLKNVTYTTGRTGIGITYNDSTSQRSPSRAGNALENLVFEEGVIEVGNRSCLYTLAKNITIPSTVTRINEYAFSDSYYVENLYWNSLGCDMEWTSFKQVGVNYDSTVLHLGKGAELSFRLTYNNFNSKTNGYRGFNYVDWGENTDFVLQKYQFRDSHICEIDFPSGVSDIPEYCFDSCTRLKTITVPSNILSVGRNAFGNCASIEDIYWDAWNCKISVNGIKECLFFKSGSNTSTLHFGDSFAENNVEYAPMNVLGASSYSLATDFTEYYPNIRYVDWGSFNPKNLNFFAWYCGIYELEIPSNVTVLNEDEFNLAKNLTILHIGKNLKTINALSSNSFRAPHISVVYYEGSEEYRYANLNTNGYLENATWIYAEGDANPADIYSISYDTAAKTCRINGFNVVGKETFAQGDGVLDILSTVKKNGIEYTVTSINANAFASNTDIKSLSLPDTLTSIGDSAFSGCSSISEISLSSTLTSIGNSAFSGCTGISEISLPSTLTSIGEEAFSGCTGISEITIPSMATNLGRKVFYKCTNLTDVTIDSPLTSIPDSCFYGCVKISDIELPSTVESIGASAFRDTAITSLTLPDGLISLGANAFRNTDLTEMVIPDSVTSIGSNLFEACTSLERVQLPNSITAIPSYFCRDCTSLSTINIPATVKSFGEMAFFNCTSLRTIDIHDAITSIGLGAFRDCINLENIVIPSSLTSIGDEAFRNCQGFTEIVIPETVTHLGGSVFFDCINLQTVTLPQNITSIPYRFFQGCTVLSNVVIPDGVTSIDIDAFRYCHNLGQITIPVSVTSVGRCAFGNINNAFTVLYGGTEEDRSAISIDSYNTALKNATWVYTEASSLSLREPVYDVRSYAEIFQLKVVSPTSLLEEPEGTEIVTLDCDEMVTVWGSLYIDDVETDWLYAETSEGYLGFVTRGCLGEVSSETEEIVSPDYSVQMYDEPTDMLVTGATALYGADSSIIKEVEAGCKVSVLGAVLIDLAESEWLYVLVDDSLEGYILRGMLEEVSDMAEPETEEPTEEPETGETIEEPAEEPTVDETIEEPTEEPAVEETVEIPVEEPTVDGTTEEPTEEPAVEETIETPVEEPTVDGTTEETIKEPTADETIKEPEEEPVVEESAVEESAESGTMVGQAEELSGINKESEEVVLQSGGIPLEQEPVSVDASILDYETKKEESDIVEGQSL